MNRYEDDDGDEGAKGARAALRASYASHPDVDLNKMTSSLSDITHDMFSIVPYLTSGGGQTDERLNKEREEAAEQFKRIREQELKQKANAVQASPKKDNLKIVPIGGAAEQDGQQ